MNARMQPTVDPRKKPSVEGAPCKSEARTLPIRTLINFWLDFLLLVNLLALGWVSVVTRFIFPPGPAAQGWLLWGWSYDRWCTVQFAVLSVFFFGILLHVMLHWSWVCGIVSVWQSGNRREKFDDGLQTIYGVGFMIVLIAVVGIALAAALFSIQRPPL